MSYIQIQIQIHTHLTLHFGFYYQFKQTSILCILIHIQHQTFNRHMHVNPKFDLIYSAIANKLFNPLTSNECESLGVLCFMFYVLCTFGFEAQPHISLIGKRLVFWINNDNFITSKSGRIHRLSQMSLTSFLLYSCNFYYLVSFAKYAQWWSEGLHHYSHNIYLINFHIQLFWK